MCGNAWKRGRDGALNRIFFPSVLRDSPLSQRALPLSVPLPSRQSMCLQIVSQAPQHFGSSETQSTCDGFFAYQSRSVICQCIRYNACPLKLTVPLRRESGFKRKDMVGQNGHNTLHLSALPGSYVCPSVLRICVSFTKETRLIRHGRSS